MQLFILGLYLRNFFFLQFDSLLKLLFLSLKLLVEGVKNIDDLLNLFVIAFEFYKVIAHVFLPPLQKFLVLLLLFGEVMFQQHNLLLVTLVQLINCFTKL